MVSAATLSNQARPTSDDAMKATPEGAPGVLNPFIKASRERTLIGPQVSQQIGASAVQTELLDIPAGGFLRYLILEVSASGGTSTGTAVLDEDGPFSILDSFVLTDVNGNPLVGPMNGYHLYLLDKYGGYNAVFDPKLRDNFSVADDENGNFSFTLRIPIEISARDGYGALANMDASQTFKVQWSFAANSAVFSTVPDGTQPTVTVKIGVEIWDRPPPVDARGASNAQFPPGHGTTQYAKYTAYDLQNGEVTQRLSRVGNNIRNLIFVWRDTSGDRQESTWLDPVRFQIDDQAFDLLTRQRLIDRMSDLYRYTGAKDSAGALDTGVFVWNFDHDLDGTPGYSNRLGLLHTHQGTKLELVGSVGEAGVLSVITNDIAVPRGSEMVGRQ